MKNFIHCDDALQEIKPEIYSLIHHFIFFATMSGLPINLQLYEGKHQKLKAYKPNQQKIPGILIPPLPINL